MEQPPCARTGTTLLFAPRYIRLVNRRHMTLQLSCQILLLLSTEFSRIIATDLSAFLRLSTFNLLSLQPLFTTYYLTTGTDSREPPVPANDMNTAIRQPDITYLASEVFDFMTPAVRAPAAASYTTSSDAGGSAIQHVVDNIIHYTKISRENVRPRGGPKLSFRKKIGWKIRMLSFRRMMTRLRRTD